MYIHERYAINKTLPIEIRPERIIGLVGRQLTESDIGKKVFRVAAFLLWMMEPDYSYVPNYYNEVYTIEYRGSIGKNFMYKDRNSIYEKCHKFKFYNDSNWITLEEAQEKLKIIEKSF